MKLATKALALILVAGFTGFGLAPDASASQVDRLLEKLVEKRILTRIEVEEMRAEIETAEKKDFKAQIKSSNSWLEGLKSKGDLRLRYESFSRENGTADRNRFRFRLRWGLEKKFNDEWKAGFRLASGTSIEPTSTNQTLENDFTFKDIFIEQAYATFTPTERVKELIPSATHVEITGGKFENPYNSQWNSTIIWDGDVTPEGIYEKMDFRLGTFGEEGKFELNTLMGQFILDEDGDHAPGDIQTYAYGLGTTYTWKKGHDLTFKGTFYDWHGYRRYQAAGSSSVSGSPNGNQSVNGYEIGNLFVATNFEVPTLFFGTKNLNLFGDFAQNFDEEASEVANPGHDNAFSFGAVLGKPKDKGEWAAGYEYMYIEPNAVVGNFSESDLGLGFANNKGHRLSYKYLLDKNIELNLAAWFVQRIVPVSTEDDEIIRTQVDLVYKF